MRISSLRLLTAGSLLAGMIAVPLLRADLDRDEVDRKNATDAKGALGGDGAHESLAEEGEANLKTISELMKRIQLL